MSYEVIVAPKTTLSFVISYFSTEILDLWFIATDNLYEKEISNYFILGMSVKCNRLLQSDKRDAEATEQKRNTGY